MKWTRRATAPFMWLPSTATSGAYRYTGPAALETEMSASSNKTKRGNFVHRENVWIKSAFPLIVDNEESN